MCVCERDRERDGTLKHISEGTAEVKDGHTPPTPRASAGLPPPLQRKWRQSKSWLSRLFGNVPWCPAVLPCSLCSRHTLSKPSSTVFSGMHSICFYVGVYFPADRPWLCASWERARKQKPAFFSFFKSCWQNGLREAA